MLSFDADNYDINSLKDLSVDAAAVLKKREGRTIKAGGLWVYDNEIAQFRAMVSSTVSPKSRSAFSPAAATIR